MTNFEFYANEIKSRGFNFAVDKSNGELFCCKEEGSCSKCEFCPDKKELIDKRAKFVCSKINIVRWLYQKHKIKMNALEYGLLEYKVERLKEEICSYEQSIRNLLGLLDKNMKAFDELDDKLIFLIEENEELRNRLKMKGDK